MPIGEILTELARSAPDRPLVTCGRVTAARGELEQQANRLARVYHALGVRQGSIVAIAPQNGIEFFRSVFATWKLGAVPLPLSHALADAERAAIVELAACALVGGAYEDAHPGRVCLPFGFHPCGVPELGHCG